MNAPAWFELLASSGVMAAVLGGITRVWQNRIEAPQRRAEAGEDYWRGKYMEVAAELKANTTALLKAKRASEIARGAAPESLPPPRDELPTLQCFVEGPAARAWADEREQIASVRAPRTRVIETYSPTARPTHPAPAGYPDAPVPLAPLFPPPRGTPRGPRGRTER